MNIVIDTHALFWYLGKDSRLTKVAERYIDDATNIFIPTIVLLELLYLFKKLKLSEKFPKILENLKKDKKYIFPSLDLDLVEADRQMSDKLEMHDSVIVTTAEVLNSPLVTKDETIQKIYKNTIW